MIKSKRLYYLLFCGLLFIPQQGWSEGTSRQLQRIADQIPCALPAEGTFKCPSLSNQLDFYIKRTHSRIAQLGACLFTSKMKQQLDPVVCNCVERLWLELLLKSKVTAQKAFLKEHQVQFILNGFPLGSKQFSSLDEVPPLFTMFQDISLSHEKGTITLRAKSPKGDIFIINLPAERELLFACDKKEQEELIREELSIWKEPYLYSEIISETEVEAIGKNLYVQHGNCYMIDSLKSDRFFLRQGGQYLPFYLETDVPRSFQNLLMGTVRNKEVMLSARYHSYDYKNQFLKMSLSDFQGYMQQQGLDFYSAAYYTEKGELQCLLLLHHPLYEYVHMLILKGDSNTLFHSSPISLNGEFYTFIPQQNIKKLFNN